MGQGQSTTNALVRAAAAPPWPGWQGQRADDDTAVAHPDIQHRKARGACASIEGVGGFVVVVVDDTDDKVHARWNIGVHQPDSGRPERSS